MQISGSIRCWRMTSTDVASAFMSSIALIEADILEVDGLLVDAHRRRRNPVREPAGLDDAAHQRRDECAVLWRSQPLALMRPTRPRRRRVRRERRAYWPACRSCG